MIRRLVGAVAAASAAVLVSVSPGLAASGFTLSGDATLVAGHNSPTGVQLNSTPTTAGAISFAMPAGTTLADLTNLKTDYKITAGDCGGGAPRFSIETPSGNVFVYLGPAPNYTGCAFDTWVTTANLVASSNLVDATQLGGGFYEPWADVVSAFGTDQVTAIDVVVDAGWKFNPQTVVFDNVQINDQTFTFESAASCKDGGWQVFGNFKNQGDCVSFFATGGKNLPSGS